MSYRFKPGESVPEGIKRIVVEELDSATEQLSRNDGKRRDETIHEARKSVKKIRGVLRLVQSELGPTYRKENRRFRELGRKLSELRDAAAIIETFDNVVQKNKETLQENTLSSVRQALDKSKQETEHALQIDNVLKGATAALRAAKKRVKTWPLKRDGFRAIAPGLRARFRRGRKLMSTAQKDPRPENYHEWRKRVKDHWYHVRLLENVWTEVMQAHEASLKNLETWLGDDHNLVVLREKLESKPEDYGDKKDIHVFLALAGEYQKELREKAMSLGHRVYEEKPRQFTKNIGKLWDAWQHQPDSMKHEQQEERQAAKKGTQSAPAGGSGKGKRTAA
ncbi:MAG: CHAD domain-containing protein [Bryobacteraceae bacterium]